MVRSVLSAVCFGILLAACAQPKPAVVMNEDQAIAAANDFLRAVMRRDYAAAYARISPGVKYAPQMRFEQFAADWDAIQEKYGALQKAVFTAYQPVPGRRVMQLYYEVSHRRPIAYHLLVEADAAGRYTIFLVDIGNAQTYPPQAVATMTPLKKTESIVVTGE